MGKILIRLFIILIIVLVILGFSLPSILSTTWGKDFAVDMLNKKIEGTLFIDHLDVSWSGPQKIQGVTVKDPDGKELLTLQDFEADASLLCLLRTPYDCGDLTFSHLNVKSTDESIPFSLQDLHGMLRFPKEGQPLLLNIDGQTTYNAQKGSISVHVELSQELMQKLLKNDKGITALLARPGEGDLIVKAKLDNFPTAALDQILRIMDSSYAGKVSEMLGATLDVTLDQSVQEKGHEFLLQGKSPNSTFSGNVLVGDDITLLKPFEVQITLSPQASSPTWLSIQKMSMPLEALTDTSVLQQKPLEMEASLVRFPIDIFAGLPTNQPMDARLHIRYDGSSLTGGATTSPLQLQSGLGNFAVQNISAKFEANNHIDVTASVIQTDPNGPIKNLLGERTEVHGVVTGALLKGDNDFILSFQSPTTTGELVGKVNLESGVHLTSPAEIKYTLGEAALRHLGLNQVADDFQLPMNVKATITTLRIPPSVKELPFLKIHGSLAIDTVAPNSQQAALEDVKAQWIIDGSARIMALDFHGLTRFGQEAAGNINGNIALENWEKDGAFDFSAATVRTNFNARRLPTEILAANYGGSDIAKILGQMFDVSVTAKLGDLTHAKGHAVVHVRSDKLEGDIALSIDKRIQLSSPEQPGSFTFTLTPEAHAAIRNLLKKGFDEPFKLTEPSRIVIGINAFDAPLPFTLAGTSFKGSIYVDQLVGADRRTQQRLALEYLQATFDSQDIAKRVEFTLTGTGQAVYGKPTSIHLTGSVDKPWTPKGGFNTDNMSVQMDGSLVAIPAPLLCKVICSDTLLSHQSDALFGPTFDATIKVQLQQMNGPISMKANGKNGNVSFSGRIQDGILTLTDNLYAEFAVTPQLGQYVLQEFIPVLNGILSSDQPLKIFINKEGFSMPIRDITPTAVSVGGAMVDIGKVQFSSQSQLAKALSLLTPENSESLKVWLTPIYVAMNAGVVRIERMDMLLNERFPLAAWGTVNLDRDRVDMIIGLSGAAIGSAFNISNVPKSYILQVPFKGPLNNPSLDKARVVGRLSALAAQSQGGAHGMVFGTVLDILSGGLKEASPPKPTTQPLPWQNLMTDADGDNTPKILPPVSAPIDEVTKGATKLINKILKKK